MQPTRNQFRNSQKNIFLKRFHSKEDNGTYNGQVKREINNYICNSGLKLNIN